MGMERIERWKWVLTALVVGVAIGLIRNYLDDHGLNKSSRIASQEVFETSLRQRIPGTQTPQLTNLRVYRIPDPEHEGKLVYAVKGWGYGRVINQPVDRFFLAPSPYEPKFRPARANEQQKSAGRLERAAEALGLIAPEPDYSVVDYLSEIQPLYNVQFTYLWWAQPRMRIVVTVLVCLVAIAGVLPTLINIVAFGSLFRPPMPKEPKQPRSKWRSRRQAQQAKSGATQADMDELKRLEAELEARLAAGARPRGQGDQPQDEAQPAIRPLTNKPLELNVPEQQEEKRTFGAAADDFYPTERRVKKEDEGK